MQTPEEFEVTETAPSPVVSTVALNPSPKAPLGGRSEMLGVLGVSRLTTWVNEFELEG